MRSRTHRFAALLALALVTLEVTGCATTSDRPKSAAMKKKTDWSKSNFSLSKNSDIDWKLLKRGKKAMGGPALDSY